MRVHSSYQMMSGVRSWYLSMKTEHSMRWSVVRTLVTRGTVRMHLQEMVRTVEMDKESSRCPTR